MLFNKTWGCTKWRHKSDFWGLHSPDWEHSCPPRNGRHKSYLELIKAATWQQQTKHKLFVLSLCAQMQKSEPVFLAGERLTPETRRLSHSLASGLTLEHLPTTPLCLDISAETPNPSSHDRQIFFFNRITSLGILALHFIFLTIQRSCALVPLVLKTTPH